MKRKQLFKMAAQGALTLGIAISLTACGKSDTGMMINGSDTMLQVGLAWKEAYGKANPDVAITVTGEGSGAGIRGLINGTVQIAHSSRQMTDSEKASVKEAHAKDPVEHVVGHDGIAVYVHPDNPVKSLSMAQLKEIWAEGGSIDNWSQVGGPDRMITRWGRNNASGTYVFFRSAVFGKKVEYKPGTSQSPGSKAVVDLCETTLSAIGYSGMGYKTDHVGLLAVSRGQGSGVEPSQDTVASKAYPIARDLFIYTTGEPKGEVKKYLDWIKGPEGQAIVKAEGFAALAN